jgi:hypothetical protein
MRFFTLLRRLWIPLALLVVFGLAAQTVSRLYDVFGSEQRPSYAEAHGSQTVPVDPTELIYEVFGAPGAAADISYFDMNGDPQLVHASLPWFYNFTVTSAAVGSVVAQGDSGTIGCRIVVDGAITTEKIMNEPSAFTFCLLKPT